MWGSFLLVVETLIFVLHAHRCLIVKTDGYNRNQIAKVVQLRANVEGLKLGSGVLDRLAEEGERGSMRYVFVFVVFIVLIVILVQKKTLITLWICGADVL